MLAAVLLEPLFWPAPAPEQTGEIAKA